MLIAFPLIAHSHKYFRSFNLDLHKMSFFSRDNWEPLVQPLTKNLVHQQYKVRISALEGLEALGKIVMAMMIIIIIIIMIQ